MKAQMVAPNKINKRLDESYLREEEPQSDHNVSQGLPTPIDMNDDFGEFMAKGDDCQSQTSDDADRNGESVIAGLDMKALCDRVGERCALEQRKAILLVGIDHMLSVGVVRQWCQRRSVRLDLQVVANGLKPVKGSVNKFMINEIFDANESRSQCDTEIQFTNRLNYGGQYPISESAKVIATSKHSQLFIVSLPYEQNGEIVGIRANDGFVLIHSNLTIYSSSKCPDSSSIDEDNINSELKSHYSQIENGYLFILRDGGHLLLIDRRKSANNRHECILLVGMSGLDLFSVSKSKPESSESSGRGVGDGAERHSPSMSSKNGITGNHSVMGSKRSANSCDTDKNSGRRVCNGDNNMTGVTHLNANTENGDKIADNLNTKRQSDINVMDSQLKKQKCDYSSVIDCIIK